MGADFFCWNRNRTQVQWDLTFGTKNEFLDLNLVGFGGLNVKIGQELWKLGLL